MSSQGKKRTIKPVAQPSSNDTVNTMKLSKIALLLALASARCTRPLPTTALNGATAKPPVETYTYDTHLDIKRVINVTDVGDQCGPVPAQMTYEDSHGQQHVLAVSSHGHRVFERLSTRADDGGSTLHTGGTGDYLLFVEPTIFSSAGQQDRNVILEKIHPGFYFCIDEFA